MLRTILLGMARGDGRSGEALLPTELGKSSSADRLLAMASMTREEFLARFERRNLIEGKSWSKASAKLLGPKLRKRLEGRVIVLGKETWSALGLPPRDFFASVNLGRAEFILVPHPSGRSKVYNDREMRLRLRIILQSGSI